MMKSVGEACPIPRFVVQCGCQVVKELCQSWTRRESAGPAFGVVSDSLCFSVDV